VGDCSLTRLVDIAEEHDLPIQMHVHETAGEVEEETARLGARPLKRLANLGILGPRLTAVHMTQLLSEEIEAVAEAGAHVVHCPQSNLKLASGIAPVAALLDAGVNVALGTDGAASNNNLDLFREMRMASLLAKGLSGNAAALPAARTLTLATLGGAHALGLGGLIGSVEPGKAADLIAIDLDRPETQPVYDPISQVVFAAGREQVTDVWVHGRRLVADGRTTTLDYESVRTAACEWRSRLKRGDGR
jgi:5-methylthioadenosine/S-adenosylhomocysteine deaminase